MLSCTGLCRHVPVQLRVPRCCHARYVVVHLIRSVTHPQNRNFQPVFPITLPARRTSTLRLTRALKTLSSSPTNSAPCWHNRSCWKPSCAYAPPKVRQTCSVNKLCTQRFFRSSHVFVPRQFLRPVHRLACNARRTAGFVLRHRGPDRGHHYCTLRRIPNRRLTHNLLWSVSIRLHIVNHV